MESTYLNYISKVSLVNNDEFKNKVKEIQSDPNWRENIFPKEGIYKRNYYDKFNKIAKQIFHIPNNMINMPNRFLLSLLLGMKYEVLNLINEDWTNSFPILKSQYEWDEVKISELVDIDNPYWTKCNCSCGHEIVIKCFITNKHTKVTVRAGKDCFEKSGFINPVMNEILKARKEALKSLKCVYVGCNKNHTNDTLKLCDKHFTDFLTCKRDGCNKRSHKEDYSAHFYHCFNHRNYRYPLKHDCRYCARKIVGGSIYCVGCKHYLDTYYFKNNDCEL